MNKKNKTIIALVLILISTVTSICPLNTNNNVNLLEETKSETQYEEESVEDNPPVIRYPKTAAEYNEPNYNFSFNTFIEEDWDFVYGYSNVSSTNPNNDTEWMTLPKTKGSTLQFTFVVLNLTNSTSHQFIMPSDLSQMWVSYLNESFVRENITQINDYLPQPDNIKGLGFGTVNINESADAQFVIWNDWVEDTNVTYHVWIVIQGNKSFNIETNFLPTPENTESDTIDWEIHYEAHYANHYDASLEIEELNNFTIKKILGYDGSYWKPINYSTDATHIYINESFQEYKVQLQTPNFISAVYNDNLTVSNNELRLYTTCKMAGNLTIRFLDTKGNFTEVNYTVIKDQIIFFNYIMNPNSSGGIGYLNITLINNSRVYFGAKFAEIMFFKDAFIWGGTGNTTAFSQLWILAPYLDSYLWNDILSRNQTQKLNLTIFDVINYSMIHDAIVTYEIGGIIGELEETIIPFNETGEIINASIYFKIIDLREFLLKPGTYNITFTASKEGYTFTKFVTEIIIFKQEVYIQVQITPPDKIFTIEESFAISINLHVLWPYYENFLRVPVNLSIIIFRNNTIDDEFIIPNVVQSFPLQGVMGNDSIPGNYKLNISIISDYYEGNVTIDIEVRKKKLDLSLIYDDEVDEDEDFDISWSLENGNFTGNRENMTLEIFLDGVLFRTVNLTATNASSGIITFKLDEGDYTLTYSLISPFYEAERIIAIEAVGGEHEEEKPSWLEENWPLLLLLILAIIAMSIFGVYMTISRRRVRAQRALDSELVALKTKLAATEENISLIQTQISEIAGIYWILVIHSEQGTTMVEITEFKFNEVLGEEFKVFVEEGMIRDSALIGGFLTAIRNFSRETSGESQEYQPIFNSQTDYSTVVNDKEVHRRILEGSGYFMAFISARGTMEISEVLSTVNSKFHEGYGEAAKEFLGKIAVFNPFKEEVVAYLHNEIRELQKRLEDEILLRQHYERHLKQVQEKIGIKKK